MKLVRMLCIAAVAAILLPLWVQAGEGEFDTEKMLSDLEKKLSVSQEELEKIKPVLERKSRELKGVMHDSVDRGFAEMEAMAKDLEAASVKAGKELDATLDSEQVRELKAYLSRLDKEALEEIRRELVAEMESFLKLTEKQVAELEPILKEQLEEFSALVSRFAKDSGKAWDDFQKEYGKIAAETLSRLEKALDKGQLDKLEKRMEETREKIHKKIFPKK
jgi:Na+/phosphate symporter